jgi:hypothetical protein
MKAVVFAGGDNRWCLPAKYIVSTSQSTFDTQNNAPILPMFFKSSGKIVGIMRFHPPYLRSSRSPRERRDGAPNTLRVQPPRVKGYRRAYRAPSSISKPVSISSNPLAVGESGMLRYDLWGGV